MDIDDVMQKNYFCAQKWVRMMEANTLSIVDGGNGLSGPGCNRRHLKLHYCSYIFRVTFVFMG